MHSTRDTGFAHSHLIIIVVFVLLVGAIAWRVASTMQEQQKAAQSQTQQQAPVPKLTAEEQEKLKAQDGDIPPTAESTPTTATTQTAPPKPTNNATTGATTQPTAPATPPAATPAAPPAPTTLRPTAEFCAQKNGASFTNVWFTHNGNYTYDGYAWEGGYSYSLPRVSKTETGTPVLNYDTMQIFDVLEYGKQPSWAVCSDKSGYVMVYYSVPGSPYTFNALAEYGHLSLQQP